VLKGRTITNVIGTALGLTHEKTTHKKSRLARQAAHLLTAVSAGAGKLDTRALNVMLTSAKNFRSEMKVQIIGTIIDLIVDANTVFFNEKGSKDLSEFLGRAGVSIAKAGATAAIGSVFAALITAGLVAASAPVALTVGLVVGGYFVAAMIVNMIDDEYKIKERAAQAAR
jgi:hypothetical protein